MHTPAETNPWQSRFADPTLHDLASFYNSEGLRIFELLFESIEERTGAAPRTEWRGIAWKWTLTFTRPTDDEPWAYIIPAAEFPVVAIPIPAAPLKPAELRRMPRFIRERILHAPRVGQVRWLELSVTSESQLTDLDKFIGRVTEPQHA
ncbi:MAG: DUF3788 family protein [Planctomycetota bacterium]